MQSFQIEILVTRTATHPGHAVSMCASSYIHRVPVAVVALAREVAFGVAVHTSGMVKHSHHRFKRSCRAGIITLGRD